MFERDIYEEEVEQAIESGEIIESYPHDTPYPSFLIYKHFQKPLHVVFAKNESCDEIIIITAYYPDSQKWSSDYKTRIQK